MSNGWGLNLLNLQRRILLILRFSDRRRWVKILSSSIVPDSHLCLQVVSWVKILSETDPCVRDLRSIKVVVGGRQNEPWSEYETTGDGTRTYFVVRRTTLDRKTLEPSSVYHVWFTHPFIDTFPSPNRSHFILCSVSTHLFCRDERTSDEVRCRGGTSGRSSLV